MGWPFYGGHGGARDCTQGPALFNVLLTEVSRMKQSLTRGSNWNFAEFINVHILPSRDPGEGSNLGWQMSDAMFNYQFYSNGTSEQVAVTQQAYVDALRAFYVAAFAHANK